MTQIIAMCITVWYVCVYMISEEYLAVFGAHIEYMKSAKENGVLIDSMMIADGFKAIQPKPMR